MKKRIFNIILALAAMLMLLSPEAFAASEKVNSLGIDINLSQDGTAYITETWDVQVSSDSTEWYLVQGYLGDIEIKDFSVKDETGKVYTNEGHSWDVDRSRSQKAGKCGIVDKADGYELCWGVGSSGHHVFTASYTMTNFVKAYTDGYDGLLQRLVNDDRGSAIDELKITVHKDGILFSANTVKMWAFGFDGTLSFENGMVVVRSRAKVEKEQYANLLLRFNENIFSPTSISAYSFQSVIEGAFEGSDYSIDAYEGRAVTDSKGGLTDDSGNNRFYGSEGSSSGSFIGNIGGFLLSLLRFTPFLVLIFVMFFNTIKKKWKNGTVAADGSIDKKKLKDIPWCRDIPFNGDLPATEYVLKAANDAPDETALMGAYLLRWSYKGNVRINEIEKDGFLGIGGGKQPVIEFIKPLSGSADSAEQKLYDMMYKASRDGNLENKEFSKWAQSNYDEIDEWYSYTKKHAERILRESGCITTVKEEKFFNLIHTEKSIFSEKGNEMTIRALGFKAYLRDFTLINERRAVEVELWDEYLVYATLFGIADEVKSEFSALYPKYFTEPCEGSPYTTRGDIFTQMYLINMLSRSAFVGAQNGRNAASMASSSSGGGGFSSFGGGGIGGGGGFSGGGSGGGGGR